MNTSNKAKVAIFDLDNTLININTTIEFIKFYLKRRNKFKYFLFLLYYYLFKDFLIILTKHDIRKVSIKFLRGEHEETLKEEAMNFSNLIKNYLNPDVQSILVQLRNEGLKIFILSSSFDLIVQALVATLELDGGKGSILEFKNNICTGKLEQDLTGNKYILLQQNKPFGAIDFQNSYCISDNKEDLELLKLFRHPLAIVSKRQDALYFEKANIKYKFVAPFLPITTKQLALPLSYFFYARANPLFLNVFVINSQIIFHLLTLYFFYGFLNWHLLLTYFLALIGFYSIYEIFYLQNDCIAFKEKYPTLRINKIICQNKGLLISWRLIWYCVISCFLVLLQCNIYVYLLANIALVFVYKIHNSINEFSTLKQYLSEPLLFFSHLFIPLSVFNLQFLYILLVFLLYGYILAKNLNFISKKYEGNNQYWLRFTHIDLIHYATTFIIYLLSLIHPSVIFFKYATIIGIYFILYDSVFSFRHFRQIIQGFKTRV